MAGKREIIVYIATSADGYIARPDGDVGWLNRPRIPGDYGMGLFMKSIDTILWGRKTYDMALGFGEKGGSYGKGIRSYVFTRRKPMSPSPWATFVDEPIGAFAKRLRRSRGKRIWMMGGAEIIGSFLDEGEIDRFIIHVIPVLIGEGIPLLSPRHREVPLELLSTKRFQDGVVRLDYSVSRRRGMRPRRGKLTGLRPRPAPDAGERIEP